MYTKKEAHAEFRRNGVIQTQELIRNKAYSGDQLKWAEGWIASQQRQWLALVLSVIAIVISVLAWLLPRGS
jgi:hypothetical protein